MTDRQKKEAERRRRHAERFDQAVPSMIYEQFVNDAGRTVTRTYRRGKLLGKGGFARCYLFTDLETNENFAGKVVQKSSLKRSRAREKLMAEIKIHRSLNHPHVVRFLRHFEDANNHYMVMELCPNQTLMEMVKRRKRLSEPEVRYFLLQMVLALEYLHGHNIIHRDLKLGNLFLSQHMRIRIGDFGLSTQVNEQGQKKTTICGTPNYIAPEVLKGAKVCTKSSVPSPSGVSLVLGIDLTMVWLASNNSLQQGGHSFEVDIWSLGCIVYTLLVGKPPFQTDDVKKTYQAIRQIHYSFPSSSNVSLQARTMVAQLLTKDPAKRLTLSAIKAHPFMAGYINRIPRHIPDWLRYAAPTIVNGEMDLRSKSQTSARAQHSDRARPAPKASRAFQALQHRDVNSPRITSKPASHRTSSKSTFSKESSKAIRSSEPKSQRHHGDTGLLHVHYNLKKSLNSPARRRMRLDEEVVPAPNNVGEVAEPGIWVTKWVDYTAKYGLGFLTCNGSVGIYFNDSSKIILNSRVRRRTLLSLANRKCNRFSHAFIAHVQGTNFEYIERSRKLSDGTRTPVTREPYTFTSFPESLKKKVTLLKHFKSHLMEQQTPLQDACVEEKQKRIEGSPDSNMVYVKKWVRTRHAILFRLSNHSVQVCFFDKSEIILCAQGIAVTYCSKRGLRSTHRLDAVQSYHPEIEKRLKYTKNILDEVLNFNNDGKTSS